MLKDDLSFILFLTTFLTDLAGNRCTPNIHNIYFRAAGIIAGPVDAMVQVTTEGVGAIGDYCH